MKAALFPDLVVNGENIPHADIANEAQNQTAPKGKPGLAWRKAANAMAIRTLMLQEAKRRDIQSDPAEIEPGRFETEEEALMRGLLDTCINPPAPTRAAIRARWAQDPSRYLSPPLWEARHILVACPAASSEIIAAAHTRAMALTEEAMQNPDGFARLAQDNSDCPSAADGGFLGQLHPGDTLPAFEAALGVLRPGGVTQNPIRTQHGFHIIRLDAEAPRRELPFEAVQKQIGEAMEKAAWARAARHFINQLVASAQISGADLAANLPGRADHEQTSKNRAS